MAGRVDRHDPLGRDHHIESRPIEDPSSRSTERQRHAAAPCDSRAVASRDLTHYVMRCTVALSLVACGGHGDPGVDAAPTLDAPDAVIDGAPVDTPVDAGMAMLAGEVRCLAGSGLTLTDGTTTVVPGADGRFTFPLPAGASYSVSVASQPTAPVQTCTVRSGATGVVSDTTPPIVVSCSGAPRYWLAYQREVTAVRSTMVVSLDAAYCPAVPVHVGVIHDALLWSHAGPTPDRRHLVVAQSAGQRHVLMATDLTASPLAPPTVIADETSQVTDGWRMAASRPRLAWPTESPSPGVAVYDLAQIPPAQPPVHVPGAFDTVYGAWSTAGDHFVALGPNRGGYVTSFDAAGTASTRAINPPYPTGSCERAWIAPDGSFAACRPTLFTSSNAWGLDLRRPTSAPVDLGTPGFEPNNTSPFTPDGHGMLFVASHDVLWVAINDGVPQPPISLIPPGLTLQTQPQVAMNSAGTLVAFAGQFDHPWDDAYLVDVSGSVPGPAVRVNSPAIAGVDPDVFGVGFDLDGEVVAYVMTTTTTGDLATFWRALPSLAPIAVPESASPDWHLGTWRRIAGNLASRSVRLQATPLGEWPRWDLGYAEAPSWTSTMLNPPGTFQDMYSITEWIDDGAATVFTARREGGLDEIYVADPHGPFGPQFVDVGSRALPPVVFSVAAP